MDITIILVTEQYTKIVFYKPNKYSVHAEKCAILKVKNKQILTKCKVIIIKIVDDTINAAYPCDACKKLLNKYGMNRIFTIINNKLTRSI